MREAAHYDMKIRGDMPYIYINKLKIEMERFYNDEI